MEIRELLSSIVVTSTSGGQNYASNVTFSQLDPTHTAVTLRDAVNAANNTSGADSISFDAGLFPPNTPSPTTIVLSGGTPLQFTDTTGATTITGPAATQVAVSGNNQSTVFLINVGVTVSISGLTITGGKGSIDLGAGLTAGGGLYNNGRLTLQNTVITSNAAGNSGGGFYNNTTGTVTVLNSTITGNSGQFGGGFFNAGTATVTASTIADNSVTSNGGGFYNLAIVNVAGSTLARNSAGVNGGGFFSNNTATVVNSTLTGNSAGSNGGGFINLKNATVIDSTIARNFATQGGGIFNSVGTVTLSGTILAQNTVSASNSTPRDWGGLTASVASSFNLIGDGAAAGLTNGTNHNLVGTAANLLNPLLAVLGDYGGPVQTMALLPGSLALAAGSTFTNPTNGQPIGTDQRGVSRSSGTSADIGAYQSAGFALVGIGGDGQSAIIDQVFASPLVVQLIENAFSKPLRSAGLQVTFTSSTTAASATLSATGVATDANGQAGVAAQANGTVGGPYGVMASAAGVDSVAFYLTNLKVPSQPPTVPTVDPLTTTEFTPILTGTWDQKNAVVLQVTISNSNPSYSVTYTLGVDPQLSVTGGAWALNLSGTTPLAIGSYSVEVHTANDIGVNTDSAVGSLVISSTPPIVGALSSPTAKVGESVSIALPVTGGDTTGLTAIINWGDGTTTTGTIASVSGILTATGSHAYVAAGTFNVSLTLMNASGLSASATSTASITGVTTGADLKVTAGQNVQIVAMNGSATYDFDIQIVSGGVKLIGANGTTFNGASTLFVANARSITGQFGNGDDRVRISGNARNVSLDLGGGQNDLSVRNFDGDKLQVSSDGALSLLVLNSRLSSLLVIGSPSAADFVQLSGVRVSNDTRLKLGGGENLVQIADSRFDDFKLQSRGAGTVVQIEVGQGDGVNTHFNGGAVFVVGGDAEITISPNASSDKTIFNGRLIIFAGSPDATWTRQNVALANRPVLHNVDVVGPRVAVPNRNCR